MPEVNATVDSLNDLVECSGVFVDKLAVFIKEKDGKIFYLRPVSERATKIVKENIEADVRFDGDRKSVV